MILRVHCDYFLSLGCSKLVANSANTSAQKIDIVIMLGLTNRQQPRLSQTPMQASGATCEVHVRKAFLARVDAIQR